MLHTIICPECGAEMKKYISPGISDLYIAGDTYGIQCDHCTCVFEVTYTGAEFIRKCDEPSLTEALENLQNNLVDNGLKKIGPKLVIEYEDGTKKQIIYSKPVRLCVNDIFGTVNVYDEDDNCLFYTFRSLVRTVMLLDPEDVVRVDKEEN